MRAGATGCSSSGAVNFSAETFITSGTERDFKDESVDAAVAEDQAGGARIVISIDAEQRDTSPG